MSVSVCVYSLAYVYACVLVCVLVCESEHVYAFCILKCVLQCRVFVFVRVIFKERKKRSYC